MSRLLDAERRNEWSTKELRQGKSAETGSIQERKSKDMGGAEEQGTVGQLSRRYTMLKRRLQDDERQREGAEISDSGDEIRIEHDPAERQGSTEGADAGADTGRQTEK